MTLCLYGRGRSSATLPHRTETQDMREEFGSWMTQIILWSYERDCSGKIEPKLNRRAQKCTGNLHLLKCKIRNFCGFQCKVFILLLQTARTTASTAGTDKHLLQGWGQRGGMGPPWSLIGYFGAPPTRFRR